MYVSEKCSFHNHREFSLTYFFHQHHFSLSSIASFFSQCQSNIIKNKAYKREYFYYEKNKDFKEEMRESPNFYWEEFCPELGSVNELTQNKCN